ncbi:MAG: DUF1926 domain-containing protein [Gammaproteobacteria bacterium]|nr:DUF1926 domain-containing protein [Gammaproteobacteria bacterium]
MQAPVTLLLGVHAHQPVGNFPAVIAEAHERCYRPFLQMLYRYPEFRFSAHFSGWLLEELTRAYPGDIALLKKMVERGQAELFGAGDCEPVLAAIPARDRIGQIEALSHRLARQFGHRPAGAWLTERVWESSVVGALAASGIRYVTVDDYHFLCTGLDGATLDSFYTAEDDGLTVDLFPISEALRYRLPFSPAAEAVAYLEGLADAGHEAAIYFDDIEKFGIWPETYAWVYERGWLEDFIRGVLASKKIRTGTYAGYHDTHRTRGIVYLPTASYIEMNEWTLPAAAAKVYDELVQQEKTAGRFERTRPFLRGGIWRNFLSRYPEANWMHKRMLGLSARLEALPPAARRPELYALLYKAQANDAYWHGLFGGLYLPHLRRAVWTNLVELEAALDVLAPRAPDDAETAQDVDFDGRRELFLTTAEVQAVIRDDGSASVHELDTYTLRHNFGDTLRRSPEHYYGKMRASPAAKGPGHGGIASAHDRVAFKHEIAPEDLLADDAGRGTFDDFARANGADVAVRDYALVTAGGGRARFRSTTLPLEKELAVSGNALRVGYRWTGAVPAEFRCVLHLAMPSCDGYAGRYVLADGRIPCGFGQELEVGAVTRLTLEDAVLGGAVALECSRPVAVRAAPHYTVSQSEAGFEKIMQAAGLELAWKPVVGETLQITLSVVPG